MNRRDFFKIAALGLAGCVAPKWAERQETMQIGDLLAKMGRGEQLSQEEQGRIKIWGNNTEFNNAFIAGLQNGQSSLQVDKLTARSGYFDTQPSKAIVAAGITSVPTGTHTPAQFDISNKTSNNSAFTLDPNDNKKLIVMPGAVGSTVMMFGSANFVGGPFNVAVRLEQYDDSDALITAYTYSMANLTANVIPFAGTIDIAPNAVYAKFALWQSSGGTVNVVTRLNIFELI